MFPYSPWNLLEQVMRDICIFVFSKMRLLKFARGHWSPSFKFGLCRWVMWGVVSSLHMPQVGCVGWSNSSSGSKAHKWGGQLLALSLFLCVHVCGYDETRQGEDERSVAPCWGHHIVASSTASHCCLFFILQLLFAQKILELLFLGNLRAYREHVVKKVWRMDMSFGYSLAIWDNKLPPRLNNPLQMLVTLEKMVPAES